MDEKGGPLNASSDAQVKYLQAIVRAKSHEIEELQLQVKTGQLNEQLRETLLSRKSTTIRSIPG